MRISDYRSDRHAIWKIAPGRFRGDENGFSLIEVLVALAIFMVIAAGIAGTLTVGLRGTVHARMASVAKQTAQQQLEEMRARPYYVPYSSDPDKGTTSDIDLLDSYYPDQITTPGVDGRGWTGYFTQSGSDAYYTVVSAPDSQNITRTVVTRFIDNNGNTIIPPANYNSNSEGNDTPPSNLVSVIVTVTWPENGGQNQGSYELPSQISSTGQTVHAGGVGGGGGSDCPHSSGSSVDVIGISVTTSTGSGDPYTTLVDGNMGEAHATTNYGCTSNPWASSIAGNLQVTGVTDPYKGAEATVTGPGEHEQQAGPVTTGPPDVWPKPSMTDTYAKAEVEGGGLETDAEADTGVGTQALQLDLGTPSGDLSGYMRWAFVNPMVTAVGSSNEDLQAEIEQESGHTNAKGNAAYQQINIMPLQKWPTTTTLNPSAPQGVVFIRNFQAQAQSQAQGGSLGSNQLSYQATVGIFNPYKSGCTYSSIGDTCYDLYNISPSNPLQNISLRNYPLENALISEWHSYTTTEINNAMTAESGKATIAIPDGLIMISGIYGAEVNWKTSNPHKDTVTVVDPAGMQKVWIGQINITVDQSQ